MPRRRSIPSLAACATSRSSAAPRAATSPSPSRAASPRPRARRSPAASPRSTSWSARRPTIACPQLLAEAERKAAIRQGRQAPAGRRRARHRLPGREQVRPPAGAAGRARGLGFPVDPGRLRQVLHLLRRALYARRRIFAAGRQGAGRGAPARRRRARSRSRCSARTSTPITARPSQDGSTWSLGAPDPRAGRDRGRRAHPLHDLPSARHG